MSEQQQEYGGIIINGIDCSGGGGSSVTPNPPAPATETLSSLDINGVVYGIEQETRENIFSIFDTFNKNQKYADDSSFTPDESFFFKIEDDDSSWSSTATIYNNNAYDLTDIDKLELVVEITQQTDYAYLWVTFSQTKYTWNSTTWPGLYDNVDSALQITQSGSYEIDVSNLTGSYYIYIGATTGKDSTTHGGGCDNTHNGHITGTVTEFNIISSNIGTSVTPNPDGNATEVLKKIKIDEDIYKIADVEEVTEEQYIALPSTKNSDNTVYMIKHIEDIFDGGSTISLLGGNGITLESSSVTGKIGTLNAYEYSAGYEGFNIALQNLTVGQTYKLEFDFQFTSAQFIGNDYRCAYLISATQKTNYTDYTQWTENLSRDLVKHHHSVQFTASATTMYLSFNLSGCSDNVNNYFTMNNIYVINTTAQNKIMLNGNQYGASTGGSGGSTVIANPSGTATATLNKVSIDGTIYDVPSGGGRGGFSSTTLYTGTQRETTINLSDDYTNYDFILVQGFSTASTGYLNSTLISVNDISTNNHIGISDDASYIWYVVTDSDTFTYDFSSGEYYIKAIYGLKESEGGGGGGEGYTKDTLYNSQITTPQQVTLSSNIDNYDVLEVVVAGGASLTPYQIDVNYFKEACPYVANPTYENDHWIIHTYQNRYIRIIMGDANNKIYPYDINNQTIEEINGIKYNASSGGGNALIMDAQIYSEDEQVIGIWTDGKPIYEKTINIGSMAYTSNWTSVAHNIANLEKIIDIDGRFKYTTDGRMYIMPTYRTGGSLGISIGADTTNIYYTNPWLEYTEGASVTLRYTKTTDTAGSGGYQAYGFSPVIYSTEEREIGVWTDNKPLYQKSWVVTSTSGRVVDLSGYNIENIVMNDGFIKASNGQNITPHGGEAFVLWYRTPTNTSSPNNCIMCTINNSAYNNSPMVVTLRYTKTTDTAGSGSYNTLGVPTVHYTTDEQVIGTWIDGKPLYRRTWNFSTPIEISANSWGDSPITYADTHMGKIINAKATAENGFYQVIGATTDNGEQTVVRIFNYRYNTAILIKYLTLEYTKTTD